VIDTAKAVAIALWHDITLLTPYGAVLSPSASIPPKRGQVHVSSPSDDMSLPSYPIAACYRGETTKE